MRATLANLVEAAGDDAEARLYRRLQRAQAAPQGICVLDGSGRVLDWVLTFESEKSVLEFLDYSVRRSRASRDATAPTIARRVMRFPGGRMPDAPPDPDPAPILAAHPPGQRCPAASRGKAPISPGDLLARVVGRALDSQGRLSTETVKQEQYSEDRFSLPAELQRAVAAAARGGAGGQGARLPDPFARLCATYAYLGHLDVRPLDNPRRGSGVLKKAEFRALPAGKPGLVRLEGETEVAGDLTGPGGHSHSVRLAWEGFLELNGDRIARLALSGRGREQLQFGHDPGSLARARQESEVAFLPAGRPINLDTSVRYGSLASSSESE